VIQKANIPLMAFLLLAFFSCKEKKPIINSAPNHSKAPVIVALDTLKGYTLNILTQKEIIKDSIYQTGKQLYLKGVSYPIGQAFKIKQRQPKLSVKTINSKSQKDFYGGLPDIRKTSSTLNNSLCTIDSALPNSKNSLPTGKAFLLTGKIFPMQEPLPVKTLPMLRKEQASTSIQYLDVDQGLNYGYINSITQIKDGTIWFGLVGYGLCKYDGQYISLYTTENGLIDNRVTCLLNDGAGNIWVGTEKGLSFFDGSKFIGYSENEGLPKNFISYLKNDKQGNIWIAYQQGGISKFDGQYISTYSTKEGLPCDFVGTISQDREGSIWVGTNLGVARFDGKSFHPFLSNEYHLQTVYSIVEDRKGNIWLGSTFYGLTKYDGQHCTHYDSKDGLSDNSIMSMMLDSDDNLWIATRNGGINKFDGNTFQVYNMEDGLSENKTLDVFEDNEKNKWIATLGGGLNKLNEGEFFQIIKQQDIGNSRVRCISEDKKGSIWLGTEKGEIYQYQHPVLTKYALGNNEINGFRTMLVTKKGDLWFGESDGNNLYQYKHSQFICYNAIQRKTGFLSLLEDREGAIWVGTSREGIARIFGDTVTYFGNKEGFPVTRVLAIFQDKKGNIWIGTEGSGLIKYNNAAFTVYTAKQGLMTESISSIVEDAKGNIWLGTLGAGICCFTGKEFIYYTNKQGLCNNEVWSIKEDSLHQIWVGTDKGLSVLVPSVSNTYPYSIASFGLQDGLKATDFNLNSVCIDNNNAIWWGTGKWLPVRKTAAINTSTTPFALSIRHIAINDTIQNFRNKAKQMQSFVSADTPLPYQNIPSKLSLAYNQNNLSFYFTAIQWVAPHAIKYSYRLLGWDDSWSSFSHETIAQYRNLPPDKYEFQVVANGQSQITTSPVSFYFTINPPWWFSWWFKTIVVFFLLGLAFFIARFFYRHQLQKQNAILEKKLALQFERQRIAAEMHDDIGAGLSGIRLLTEITKNKLTDKKTSDELKKIHEQVGNISTRMREVIWSLDTSNDYLPNLVEYIVKQARMMMEHYNGVFTYKASSEIPMVQVGGETRRHIYLTVKEALHNVIKHSKADKVNMAILYADNSLRIIISDNGIGVIMNDPGQQSGNGIRNMKERMTAVNGSINYIHKNGLTIELSIPF